MIIQEPIKATIWFALENYAYSDAIFLSERLYAEVNTEENLHLLATAYFRSGKANMTYSILSRNEYNPIKSPNCHFLRAKSCFQLGKIQEAINLLLEPISDNLLADKKFSKEQLTNVYGESSSFVAQLLGQVFYRLEDFEHSAYYYALSLKINPFLWSSYEKLLQIDPNKADQDKLFNMDSFDLKYSCGTNPLISLFNSPSQTSNIASDSDSNRDPANEDTASHHHHHYFVTPEIRKNVTGQKTKIELASPYAILKQSPGTNKVDVITPISDGSWQLMSCMAPTKNIARNSRKFNSPSSQVLIETSNLGVNRNLLSRMDTSFHSFGVLTLDRDTLNVNGGGGMGQTPTVFNKIDMVVSNKSAGRTNKDSLGAPMMLDGPIEIPIRRSNRLNSDARSIKENASSPVKKLERRVTPVKRCRTMNFDKSAKLIKRNNENSTSSKVLSFDVNKAGVKAQRSSASGLLELIKKFAGAYKRLAEYRCKDAIEAFEKLPRNHYNTGFVLVNIGRCHFEMGSFEDAIECFKICRILEPYRLQGLEYYSTALWHLQKELELSCLSQELIQFDKMAPETWCVAGNCFSLQKDHEVSIKFLKRAIQVDPYFSYAYTLLGHELISADELDNAMSCFTNACRIDPRHYNAWCGMGLIYYKQEKYESALYHYKRALDISKFNPILMCHLAMVYHHLKQSKRAIAMLNEASKLDPNNVLIKYHRASIRFSLKEYSQAKEELEELKKLCPKESMIYFLIGKIYKLEGDTHLAVMNFSWAVHIDPKGSTNQHKEFMEPNQSSSTDDGGSVNVTQQSTPRDPDSLLMVTTPSATDSSSTSTTPFTQRSTYITGLHNSSSNYNNLSDVAEIDDLMDGDIEEELGNDDDLEPSEPSMDEANITEQEEQTIDITGNNVSTANMAMNVTEGNESGSRERLNSEESSIMQF